MSSRENPITIEKNSLVSGEITDSKQNVVYSYEHHHGESLVIEVSVSENATGPLYFYSKAQDHPNFVLGTPGSGWRFVHPGETRTFGIGAASEFDEGTYYLEAVATDSTAPEPPEANSGAYTFTIQTADEEDRA